MKKKHLFLSLCCILFFFQAKGQHPGRESGVGIELIYNMPIEEIGIGARFQHHLNYTFVLAGQADYYPGFNQVHELLLGVDLQARIQSWRMWGFYVFAGPYYDHWFNHEESSLPEAKASNFTIEGGIGFAKNYGCLRPFAEYRINSKWWESNIRAGVVFYFKSCGPDPTCPTYQRGKFAN